MIVLSSCFWLVWFQTSSKTINKLAHPNAPIGYGLCFLNLAFDGFTNATQDSLTARYVYLFSPNFCFCFWFFLLFQCCWLCHIVVVFCRFRGQKVEVNWFCSVCFIILMKKQLFPVIIRWTEMQLLLGRSLANLLEKSSRMTLNWCPFWKESFLFSWSGRLWRQAMLFLSDIGVYLLLV